MTVYLETASETASASAAPRFRPLIPTGRGPSSLQCGVMRRRSFFRNWTEYALAVFVVKSLELTPLWAAQGLARGYTRLLDLAIPRLRRVAKQNLAFALPLGAPDPVMNASFRLIFRLLVSFARFPSIRPETIGRW